MQRYCLTLNMIDDPALQAEYVARHRAVWPEVLQSLRDAGVIDMQIFLDGAKLVMVIDTTDEFTFERKAAMDQANPVVMRWESEMARFQGGRNDVDASQKWQRVACVFDLRAQLEPQAQLDVQEQNSAGPASSTREAAGSAE